MFHWDLHDVDLMTDSIKRYLCNLCVVEAFLGVTRMLLHGADLCSN